MKNRGILAIAIAVLVLAGGIPFVVSDGADAVDDGRACDGILIYEVAAKFGSSNEGFSLRNYGSSPVDLSGYYLMDGNSDGNSYKFTITSSVVLDSNESVTFTKASASVWFGDNTRTIYTYSDVGTKETKFNFDDSGDFLQLYDSSSKLKDTVVFGNGKISTSNGWSGMAIDLGYRGEAVKRVESTDTDTYFDWTSMTKDYTSHGFRDVPTFNNVKVTPFTFPESKGKPIFEAVMAAESSVYISIYMLTSEEMISTLATLASEGKDIKVLLEYKPLGYDQDLGSLKNIINKGGQVSFIGYKTESVNYDRYSYVHNKYAIIDNTKVIVTSENWTYGNLGGEGNRGWGAVVESTGYASYMKTYFDNDFDGDDIISLPDYEAVSGAITAKTLPSKSKVSAFVSGLDYSASTYTADIRMYMSPDNTFKALQYYIDKATKRVYTEQMDIGASYTNLSNTSPVSALVSAAERGVDARFLLADSSKDAKALVSELNSKGVKSANMTPNGYKTMHNKGVIIDDAVWLSSVNWTENAFINNRECGLYIMSPEVSSFYADAYDVDWKHDYKEPEPGLFDNMPVWLVIAIIIVLIVIGALWTAVKKKAKKKVKKTVKKAVKGKSKKK